MFIVPQEFNLNWNATVNKGRTKWEILTAREAELREYLEKLESELIGLERTPCGLECGGCGEYLITEKDFAAHFIVTDEHYLNLGWCPNRGRNKRNG